MTAPLFFISEKCQYLPPQENNRPKVEKNITWVYLASDRSILACMVFHLVVNFMQEKIAMTQETKCVETVVITIAAAVIVIVYKDMFFETRHVGRLLTCAAGPSTPSG